MEASTVYTYFDIIPSELIDIILNYINHDSILKFYSVIKHFYSAKKLFILKHPLLYKDINNVIQAEIRLDCIKDKWMELYNYIWYINCNLKTLDLNKLIMEDYIQYYDFEFSKIYKSYVYSYIKRYNLLMK